MDLDREVFIVFFAVAQHIVIAHTPRENLIALWCKRVAVIATSRYKGHFFVEQ
jgi:hypothetical protein